jgi:hypothetical protein
MSSEPKATWLGTVYARASRVARREVVHRSHERHAVDRPAVVRGVQIGHDPVSVKPSPAQSTHPDASAWPALPSPVSVRAPGQRDLGSVGVDLYVLISTR